MRIWKFFFHLSPAAAWNPGSNKYNKPAVKSLQPARKPWKPPPAKIFKTNFDSALFESEGSTGIGVIIRDSHSEVLASMSEK